MHSCALVVPVCRRGPPTHARPWQNPAARSPQPSKVTMSAPFDPQATPVPPVPGPLPDPTAPPPAPVFQPTAAVPPPAMPAVPAQIAPLPPALPPAPPTASGPTPSLFGQPSVWNVPPPARRRRWWAWTLPLVPILLLAVCAYGSHVLGRNDG